MTGPLMVAGVDTSTEGGWAAVTAWRLANAVSGRAVFVHAVSDAWVLPGHPPGITEHDIRRHLLLHAVNIVRASLGDRVPAGCLDCLEVRIGPAAHVLAETAVESGASLIVVGGKRHSALGRWLAGSTVHQLLRTSDLPVLVATPSMARVRRVLVALDVDETAASTIAAAEQLARRLGAKVRFVHALAPIPYALELEPLVDLTAMHDATMTEIEKSVWPLIADPDAERFVREGNPTAVIEVEARSWGADLVVVGHHGRSGFDRAVLGSVSYDLLHDLPASVMVVHPTAIPAPTPAITAGRP